MAGSRARGAIGAARLAALAFLAVTAALTAGCARQEPPKRGVVENLVLVTLCGARPDVLDELVAAGELPALAVLSERARIRTTARVREPGCHAGTEEILFETLRRPPAAPTGGFITAASVARSGLPQACRADGYRCGAFVSRSEFFAVPSAQGFEVHDGPVLERFSVDLFGEDAVPYRLRRDATATVAAAVPWLRSAISPFFLWLQLDALAIEAAAAPAELHEAARARLRAVDAALAPLLAELARAGRDRRTLIVLTADHGEALGEDGWYGCRFAVEPVLRVPLWVVDPDVERDASAREAGEWTPRLALELPVWLARRLELTGAAAMAAGVQSAIDAPTDPAVPAGPPPAFEVARGDYALDDASARRLLPLLRPLVGEGEKPAFWIGERYVAALHALAKPTPAEQEEMRRADERWLREPYVSTPGSLLLATIWARTRSAAELPVERREVVLALSAPMAPWYFPAIRALASLRQPLDPHGALEALEWYEEHAPLSVAARADFTRLLEGTRRRLAGTREPPR